MLPAKGFFKGFDCPFFEWDLCQRNYCHYKHFKQEKSDRDLEKQQNVMVPKIKTKATYNPTPISELNKQKLIIMNKERTNVDKNNYLTWTTQENIYPNLTSSHYGQNYDMEESSSISAKYNLKNCPKYSTSNLDSPELVRITSFDLFKPPVGSNTNNTELNTDENSDKSEKSSSANEEKSQDKTSRKLRSGKNQKSSDSKTSRKDKKAKNNKDWKTNKPGKNDKNKSSAITNKSKSSHSHNKGKIKVTLERENESNTSKILSGTKINKPGKNNTYKSRADTDKSKSNHRHSKEKMDILIESSDETKSAKILSDSEISELDEITSTVKESKKFFDEFQPVSKNSETTQSIKSKLVVDGGGLPLLSKNRVAYENASKLKKPVPVKPKFRPSAAQIMTNRYKANASSATYNSSSVSPYDTLHLSSSDDESSIFLPSAKTAKKIKSQPKLKQDNSFLPRMDPPHLSSPLAKPLVSSAFCNTQPLPIKKHRIAHAVSKPLISNARKKVAEYMKTPMQTSKLGRVAHVPNAKIVDIPLVLDSESSRLPINVRQTYLVLMVNEASKYLSKQEAFDRALKEELSCYKKCSKINTYKNSAMLGVYRLRKEGTNPSHDKNSVISDKSEKLLYERISKWILSEKQLDENGFPRPGRLPGQAEFKDNKSYENIPNGFQRCSRCKLLYKINKHGTAINPEDCSYHPKGRFISRGESRYICCGSFSAAYGCCIASTHVYEIRDFSNLRCFVKTKEPDSYFDLKSKKVYALDCEMIYTTRGIELARVTVVNEKCEVVFESMCRPIGKILDCNTRFSGITYKDMAKATTTFLELQADLLQLFNSKTILIGHSLESDLKALRLIHETVIDTSVLFPHKLGPQKKRALKSLASEYLQKIIQNDESGHDSAEDAKTCMELIMWKLKEE